MFIATIGTLHNFVRIHDGDDYAEDLAAALGTVGTFKRTL
jgi:hypothetical protein